MEETLILCIWIGFLALMIVSIAGILVWAVRSRQFTDQERARYLALESGIPVARDMAGSASEGRGLR
ncbi:hypothetical protein [Geobacter sp. SVR]|uniref:hypothetical protein n=1 Tax=Geobacter sp. SVR TaxID=2495594 RepID=UPI00143EFE0E|nr:hypothetical protein [Geobacter sp. SVR]BCS54206.1 hypothetical protein GSVR_25140 [Geobacter sp. SVR]GCF85935.1 hypothetical protein GSbR_25350 [Geobacter sp. SVR]